MCRLKQRTQQEDLAASMTEVSLDEARLDRELCDAIEAGFQLATQAGPMCSEPMQGLAFLVQDVQVDDAALSDVRGKLSQLASTLISSTREACRQGLLDWSPRLMLAMYACDIQAARTYFFKTYHQRTCRAKCMLCWPGDVDVSFRKR